MSPPADPGVSHAWAETICRPSGPLSRSGWAGPPDRADNVSFKASVGITSAMHEWSFWLAVVGATLSLAAGVWLTLGFDPMSRRYLTVEGGGYGRVPTEATGVRLLLKHQSRAAGLAVVGGALQLVAVIVQATGH